MIIYYNPDCSKCQEASALLSANGCSFTIRDYLKEPPTAGELNDLVELLGCRPIDLVRTKEPLYQEIAALTTLRDDELINLLTENPMLLERPIVIDGQKAIIGRPPLKVLELIKR